MSNRQSSFPLNTYIVLITFESKFSQVKSARNTTVEWLLAWINRSIYLRKVKRDDRSSFGIILSYRETQNIDVNRSYITSKGNIGTGRELKNPCICLAYAFWWILPLMIRRIGDEKKNSHKSHNQWKNARQNIETRCTCWQSAKETIECWIYLFGTREGTYSFESRFWLIVLYSFNIFSCDYTMRNVKVTCLSMLVVRLNSHLFECVSLHLSLSLSLIHTYTHRTATWFNLLFK